MHPAVDRPPVIASTFDVMTSQSSRAQVFGEVADEYDRVRPDYPAQLFDDVVDYARLDGRPALEVGAGTGKATRPFADRGVTVVAIEPDQAMAQVLADRLAGRSNVRVFVTTFEDHASPEPVGLIYSAQAWHWTDPATRWQRAVRLLAPGGALALFWNYDRPADPGVTDRLAAAHRSVVPDWSDEGREAGESTPTDDWPRTEMAAVPELGGLSERLYGRTRSLSTADYVALLDTQSAYRILEPDVRTGLFEAAAAAIGDRIDLVLQTVLYLGRRN